MVNRCPGALIVFAGWLAASGAEATIVEFSGGVADAPLAADFASAVDALSPSSGWVEGGGFTPEVSLRWSARPAGAQIRYSSSGGAVRLDDNGTGVEHVPIAQMVFDPGEGYGAHVNRVRLRDLGDAAGGHILRVEVWGERPGGQRLAVMRRVDVPEGGEHLLEFAGCFWPGRVIVVVKHLQGEAGALGIDDVDFDQRRVFTVGELGEGDAPGTFSQIFTAATAAGERTMVTFDRQAFRLRDLPSVVGSGEFSQPSADVAVAGLGHTRIRLTGGLDVPGEARLYLAGVGTGSIVGGAGSLVELSRCNFVGGGVAMVAGTLLVDGCDFDLSDDSGTRFAGAISCLDGELEVRGCRFHECDEDGDAFGAGAIAADGCSRVRVVDCANYGGSSNGDRSAGGFALRNCQDALIDRCYFHDCSSFEGVEGGGALYIEGPATVANCTIARCYAFGSEAFIPQTIYARAGAFEGECRIVHSTFVNNGFLPEEPLVAVEGFDLEITNCIQSNTLFEPGESPDFSIRLDQGGGFRSGGGNHWQNPGGTTGWLPSDVLGADVEQVFGSSRYRGLAAFDGGFSASVRLEEGKSAVDAGGASPPHMPYADACLRSRSAGLAPDSGAYEFHPDRDGDGMDDEWEIWFRLDPDDPSDAGKDPDGDGATTLAEFFAATDPRDTASGVKLEWEQPGINDPWGPMSAVLVHAEPGSVMTFRNMTFISGDPPQRFYFFWQNSSTGERMIYDVWLDDGSGLRALVKPFGHGVWITPDETQYFQDDGR